MDNNKLAVFFPGIGYNCDKPLLYYSKKIMADKGYDLICCEYTGLPKDIKGKPDKMKEAYLVAFEQCKHSLKDINFTEYEDILLVGKSIGTVIATHYASGYVKRARCILFTPLEATFIDGLSDTISFYGNNDPWSNYDEVVRLAKEKDMEMHLYNEANHSLETSSVIDNIDIVKDVIKKVSDFVDKRGI